MGWHLEFTHRPMVVPFWGSYLESYTVIPKRNYYGAYGYKGLDTVVRALTVQVEP